MTLRTLRSQLCRALLILALPAQVHTAAALDLNLNSVFNAVKGVAKSREAANMSEADEIAIGHDIAARTLGAYPVVKNDALQHYVNNVGLWVALQSDRAALPWRFAVVQSEQINAFAVPGGVILITNGMMSQLANEAELACVIGHEVGHVVRKHHLALMEKGALIDTGTQLVSDNIKGGTTKGMAQQFAAKEGAELFTRSLDRGAERDADADGVLLAARAGYDPGACLTFMQRMAQRKTEDNTLASLYKTHPQARERAVDVEAGLLRLDGASAGDGAKPPLAKR